MPDFVALPWLKKPTDGDLASALRRDIRKRRRERGRGGHRFRYTTLKSLWLADDIHAVLNHTDDPAWQYWKYDYRQGWELVGWYMTRREAQAVAEMPRRTPPPRFLAEGLYVLAGWPGEDKEFDYTMKVFCHDDKIADELLAVFTNLGCVATKSLLAA